jgi:hypothetical protein
MTNARIARVLGWAFLLAAAPADAQTPGACPSPPVETRARTAQLQQQTAQLGTLSPEVSARIGVMQSVLQAREAERHRDPHADAGRRQPAGRGDTTRSALGGNARERAGAGHRPGLARSEE